MSYGCVDRDTTSSSLSWAFLAVTLTATALAYFVWPIRAGLGHLVIGSAIFAPDAVLNIGILEWGYASIQSPDLKLFEWTAGFPMNNTLAATENLLGWQPAYFMLRSAELGPVGAYNALLVSSIPISGMTTALLARQLGASRTGAFISAFVFAFAPFHISQLGHIQIMGVCWAPLPFLFLDRLLGRGRWRDAGALTLAFLVVCTFSMYVGVFVVMGLILYVAAATITGRCHLTVPTSGRLAVSALVAIVALSPLLSRYWRFRTDHELRHPAGLIIQRSLGLEDFLRPPGWQRALPRAAPTDLNGTPPEVPRVGQAGNAARGGIDARGAFPGAVALALVLSWFAFRQRTPALRPAGTTLLLLVAAITALSLGPSLKIHSGYESRFADFVPLPGAIWYWIPGIRNVWKFHILGVLFGSLLCGFGVTAMLKPLRARQRFVIVAGVLGLSLLENWPATWVTEASHELPAPLALSDAYPYLAHEASAGGVVELPIADASGYQTPMLTRYAYGSAGHHRRVVAIHGTARLPVTTLLLDAANALPDPRSLETLVSAGVTRLVVHRALMPRDAGELLIARLRAAGYPIVFAGRESVVFGMK